MTVSHRVVTTVVWIRKVKAAHRKPGEAPARRAAPRLLNMGVAPSRNRLTNTVCQHTPTNLAAGRGGGWRGFQEICVPAAPILLLEVYRGPLDCLQVSIVYQER